MLRKASGSAVCLLFPPLKLLEAGSVKASNEVQLTQLYTMVARIPGFLLPI